MWVWESAARGVCSGAREECWGDLGVVVCVGGGKRSGVIVREWEKGVRATIVLEGDVKHEKVVGQVGGEQRDQY